MGLEDALPYLKKRVENTISKLEDCKKVADHVSYATNLLYNNAIDLVLGREPDYDKQWELFYELHDHFRKENNVYVMIGDPMLEDVKEFNNELRTKQVRVIKKHSNIKTVEQLKSYLKDCEELLSDILRLDCYASLFELPIILKSVLFTDLKVLLE